MAGARAIREDVWLRAVWEAASDAMALSDREGRVLAANPAYFALYGYRPEEVLGQSFAVIFPEGERAAAEAQYRQVFCGPASAAAFESVVRRRDGSERIVEARANFLVEAGRRVAMLSVVRDVTAEVVVRRAATQVAQERRAFLSGVAHDLKTPLAVIRGQAQVLRRGAARQGVEPAETLAAGLAQIEASTIRLSALIDELVAVADPEAGAAPPLRPVDADLVALARAAVARHQRPAGTGELALAVDRETLPGRWDAPLLERVLDNLLANAIKYSPDDAPIVLRLAPGGPGGPGPDGAEGVRFAVEDRGIGIPAADLPHVFERYRRGGNVADTVRGSGVGLSSVKHIVEQHGGTVGIVSREGAGTTVTVWLPLRPPAEAAAGQP